MRMDYKIQIDEKVKTYIEELLSRYDMSKMEYIRYTATKAKYPRSYCSYPISQRKANKNKARGWKARKYFHIVNKIPIYPSNRTYKYIGGWEETNLNYTSTVQSPRQLPDRIQNRTNGRILIFKKAKEQWNEKMAQWSATYDAYERMPIDIEEETAKGTNEHIVWLTGHELFHFLRKTRQIEGRNTQNQANGFGIKCLREYRRR